MQSNRADAHLQVRHSLNDERVAVPLRLLVLAEGAVPARAVARQWARRGRGAEDEIRIAECCELLQSRAGWAQRRRTAGAEPGEIRGHGVREGAHRASRKAVSACPHCASSPQMGTHLPPHARVPCRNTMGSTSAWRPARIMYASAFAVWPWKTCPGTARAQAAGRRGDSGSRDRLDPMKLDYCWGMKQGSTENQRPGSDPSGLRLQGSGFKVQGSRFRAQGAINQSINQATHPVVVRLLPAVCALEDVEPRALQRLRLALPTRHRQPPTVPGLRERTDRTRMTSSIQPDWLLSQIGRLASSGAPLTPTCLPYKVDTSRPSLRTNWTRLGADL
jgi:hypothetical protein